MIFELGSHEWQLQAFAGARLGGEESILTQLQGLYPAIDQAVLENLVQQFKNSIEAGADQYQLVQTNVTETVALATAQQQVYDELTNFLARPNAGQLVGEGLGQD